MVILRDQLEILISTKMFLLVLPQIKQLVQEEWQEIFERQKQNYGDRILETLGKRDSERNEILKASLADERLTYFSKVWLNSLKNYNLFYINQLRWKKRWKGWKLKCGIRYTVRIKFNGRAETEWYESKSEYNALTKKHQTRRMRYSAEEVYFDEEFTLTEGGENFMLPAGKHTYPFSYILPRHLPSSFEGSHGNIRYVIKAVIDRPWKFDYEAKIQLEISSPLDLNYIPGSRDPLYTSAEKHVSCCWCKSGPITLDISLPVRGYCTGQQINIGAYVQNMSNVSADNVKFRLYKIFEFISHIPSIHYKFEERFVAECVDGGVGAHGEKSWTSIVPIPSNEVYPNLTPCSIINIYYQIKAKVVFPCPHANLEVKFPLVIGTIPFIECDRTSNFGPSGSQFPIAPYPGPAFEDLTAPLVSFSPSSQNSPSTSASYQPVQPNKVTGYLAMKVGRTAALALGSGIIILELANQKGYIKINWNKVNKQVNKVTDKIEKQIFNQNENWTDKVENFVDKKVDQVEELVANRQKAVQRWYSSFTGGSDYRLNEIHLFVVSFVAGIAIGIGTA
ncbi:hypothetical protein FQR65_LT00983 [Abscondita terminalis]|nr:hypothetical protein FQR65_LT00983 [Abscondita terminalis]